MTGVGTPPADAPRAGEAGSSARDDRVLWTTRALAAFIAPFLLVAFGILYGLPGRTAQLWAWPIASRMTSMLLASAYLGGCYFFLRVVLVERRWAAVRAGFVSVALFASLLGVATVIHWDKFSHAKVAFWVWAALYFTAPFLVVAAWVANDRYAARPAPGDARLGRGVAWSVVGVSALAALTGLFLFVAPRVGVEVWPWPLTPLTARVVGATFCLGAAGLVVLVDDRWDALRSMREVQLVMFGLVLVAAVRARHEFLPGRPLTWLMGVGFVALLLASLVSLLRGAGRPSTGGHSMRARPAPH